MHKSAIFSSIVTIVLLLSLFSTPAPVKAATGCECVTYVKNYFGITEAVGNAYQMGTWLASHGFTKISSPQVGAIAVMQRNFPGANTASGHVGIIASVSDMGTKWKITLKGANQEGTGAFTEFDCNNVKNTSWSAYLKSNTSIAYYKTNNYAIRSAVTRSGSANLYFDIYNGSTASGAYVIGWTYHGGNNQLFNFVQYNTEYRIIARNSAMCIQPQYTSQGARLLQKKCTGAAIERWQKLSTSTGYILKNSSTGLVVDLSNGSLSPGNSILIWGSHNGTNQRWWLDIK